MRTFGEVAGEHGWACVFVYVLSSFVLLSALTAQAQTGSGSTFEQTAAAQAAANSKPGPRAVPGRKIPVPTADVSPEMQKSIAAPYVPMFDVHPRSAAEWKALVSKAQELREKSLPQLRSVLGVEVKPVTIGGVKAFEITPKSFPEANRKRLVLHFHGGGYVLNPGEAGTVEGMIMASIGGFRVITIDYRMPPDAPFPAALDDSVAVWKELVKTTPPKSIAFIGTSAGGGLMLATALRLKNEKLPLPGAMSAGTPWADLTKTGDSYFANEWLDNLLVTWDGWLGQAAYLYAAGRDLKEPYLSPIYGDFSGLPPTILTTGTRDLFLSNTVRTHRKLRRAGVEAELDVYEGMSHDGYQDPSVPETSEIFSDIARFFDRHLGK